MERPGLFGIVRCRVGAATHSNGTKNFVIRYVVAGRKRQAILCRAAEVNLKDIRKRAADQLMTIRSGDADPLERKRQQRDAPTFADLWARFEDEWAPERITMERMTKRTLREYGDIARQYILPALGPLKVSAITRDEIGTYGKEDARNPSATQ